MYFRRAYSVPSIINNHISATLLKYLHKSAVLSNVSRLSKYTTKRIPTVMPTLDTHVEKNGTVQGETGALNKGAFPARLCD